MPKISAAKGCLANRSWIPCSIHQIVLGALILAHGHLGPVLGEHGTGARTSAEAVDRYLAEQKACWEEFRALKADSTTKMNPVVTYGERKNTDGTITLIIVDHPQLNALTRCSRATLTAEPGSSTYTGVAKFVVGERGPKYEKVRITYTPGKELLEVGLRSESGKDNAALFFMKTADDRSRHYEVRRHTPNGHFEINLLLHPEDPTFYTGTTWSDSGMADREAYEATRLAPGNSEQPPLRLDQYPDPSAILRSGTGFDLHQIDPESGNVVRFEQLPPIERKNNLEQVQSRIGEVQKDLAWFLEFSKQYPSAEDFKKSPVYKNRIEYFKRLLPPKDGANLR